MLFPHERSLVKQLTDQPFALIGVNTDASQEDALKQNAKQKITWRSFWDGGRGPISSQWNVHAKGFPTTYLLDPAGTIRFEFAGMAAAIDGTLDDAIELLLAEAGANVSIEHPDENDESAIEKADAEEATEKDSAEDEDRPNNKKPEK